MDAYMIFDATLKLCISYLAIKLAKWLLVYVYDLWFYSRIPGLPIIPFIGNALQFAKAKSEYPKEQEKVFKKVKNEKMFRWWIGVRPTICIFKSEALKLTQIGFCLGIQSSGEKWLQRRKLITPTFHFDILRDFLLIMNEHAVTFVSRLAALKNKNNVDMEKYLKAFTLDVICETAMGQKVDAQTNELSDYLKTTKQMTELILERIVTPWLWPDFIFQRSKCGRKQKKCLEVLHGFTREIIRERADNFHGIQNVKRLAFLDMLLEVWKKDSGLMSLDDVAEEVDTFMFEGHDTITSALNWTCFNIATNPHIQQRVREEIDNVCGQSTRQVTSEDLGQMNYLECVIKETLRIFPPVPQLGRSVDDKVQIGIIETITSNLQDLILRYNLKGEYSVKPGASLLIGIFWIHRDERYFPEPEIFRPERFSPENIENIPPFAYIPFSFGRRNCIGQKFAMLELKLLMTYLLRNFEIECDQTLSDVKYCFDLVLRPETSISIRLKERLH